MTSTATTTPRTPRWPIFCIGAEDDSIDERNCVIAVGDTFGAPIFQHAGAEEDKAVRCDCGTAHTHHTPIQLIPRHTTP